MTYNTLTEQGFTQAATANSAKGGRIPVHPIIAVAYFVLNNVIQLGLQLTVIFNIDN